MPDLNDQYNALHRRQQEQAASAIRSAYEASISEIALRAAAVLRSMTPSKQARIFRIKDYPTLMQTVEREIEKLHGSIYTTVVNSIMDSWELSNVKNSMLVDKRLAGKSPTEAARRILYDPNIGALRAFLERKDKGITLSDRVWNTLDNYATEMEAAIGVHVSATQKALGETAKGVSEGTSASKMARELKQYLKEPDRLYRRVREVKGDKESQLRLSKAATDYKPGQGVYRSSYKNALRLTKEETNLSYRKADFERWKQLPFVIGIRTRLSNRHPEYDICDPMSGKLFPKDFLFTGWHVGCLCTAIPEMMSDAQYEQYEDYILGLTDEAPKVEGVELPAAFTDWVKDNKDRINGWGSLPYWVSENEQYTKKLLQPS